LRFVTTKCGALSGLILGFNLPRALPKLMVLGLSPDAALRHLVSGNPKTSDRTRAKEQVATSVCIARIVERTSV
jgi:hypothetical protein